MDERPLLELLQLAERRQQLITEADELQREVGLKLRSVRSAAGLSQSEVAAFAGVSQPYLSQVEAGASVNPETLSSITNAIATVSITTTGGSDVSTTEGKGTRGKARNRKAEIK